MQEDSYANLYALILALSGNDSFTTNEQVKILGLANRRLYQAYRSSELWPRYVIGAQARPCDTNLIIREYDAPAGITGVTSASRSGDTVTIVATDDVNFRTGMYVTISGLLGSVSPNGTYQVSISEPNTFTYSLSSGTGMETYTGTGIVTPIVIPDIDSFSRVWASNPLLQNSAIEYEFWVDSEGAHVVNNFSGLDVFWVGFKKEWGGPYTALSTDIPQEFFWYAAHATYADYLRLDGQNDKAVAEEQIAQQYLVVELDKAENQRNTNALARRISTNNSRQAR